jgi:hypothetical protein
MWSPRATHNRSAGHQLSSVLVISWRLADLTVEGMALARDASAASTSASISRAHSPVRQSLERQGQTARRAERGEGGPAQDLPAAGQHVLRRQVAGINTRRRTESTTPSARWIWNDSSCGTDGTDQTWSSHPRAVTLLATGSFVSAVHPDTETWRVGASWTRLGARRTWRRPAVPAQPEGTDSRPP